MWFAGGLAWEVELQAELLLVLARLLRHTAVLLASLLKVFGGHAESVGWRKVSCSRGSLLGCWHSWLRSQHRWHWVLERRSKLSEINLRNLFLIIKVDFGYFLWNLMLVLIIVSH